jgi:hypothetical protein
VVGLWVDGSSRHPHCLMKIRDDVADDEDDDMMRTSVRRLSDSDTVY